MPKSARLFELLEDAKKKGRVTSSYREPEHNKRVGGKSKSYHQIQGGAYDIMGLSKKDGEKLVKKLRSENFYAYRNKFSGQIHADIGPYGKKEERIQEFDRIKKEHVEAKGRMMGLSDSQRAEMQLAVSKNKSKNSIDGTSLVEINEKPMSKKNKLISRAQAVITEDEMDEEARRRRARFLAVQGGTEPPQTVTKVLGVDRGATGNSLITEEVASPVARGEVVSDTPFGPPAPAIIQRRRDPSTIRPINEDTHAKTKAVETATEEAVEKSAKKAEVGMQMIKSQKKEAKEVVQNLDLDEKSKKEVIKDIDNISKGKSGPKSQFTHALQFFLPNIIGALGGYALGGDEGLVAGAEEAAKLKGSYFDRESELASRQIKMQRTSAPDLKTFVDSTTGKPIQQKGGRFFDLTGREVDPTTVTQAVTFRQSRSLQSKEQQEAGKDRRFDARFDFDKDKAAQLSGEQQEAIGGLESTMASISQIEALQDDVDTGPLASRFSSLAELADWAPEKFVQLKSTVKAMQNDYIKAITGAQMSEAEAQRIMAVAPDINDNDKTFKLKLKAFKKIVVGKQRAILEAIRSGQKLKRSTVDAMLADADKALAEINKGTSKKKGKKRVRMTDAQRKRLAELRAKKAKAEEDK